MRFFSSKEKMGEIKEKPARLFKYGPTTDVILNYFDYFTYSGKNFGHCTNPYIIEQETKVPLRGQRQT